MTQEEYLHEGLTKVYRYLYSGNLDGAMYHARKYLAGSTLCAPPFGVTQNVTSVEPEPDDPQNTGSKPESKTLMWYLSPEGYKRLGYW